GSTSRRDYTRLHPLAGDGRGNWCGEPMTPDERLKLLFGPYTAPPLKRGNRAFCLYRNRAVLIGTWSDAPIPWPRCYLADRRACAFGVLVDEELARALRHESAAAIGYWGGVSRNTVRRWRGALGIRRMDPEGSRRLMLGAVQATIDIRPYEGRLWSPEET